MCEVCFGQYDGDLVSTMLARHCPLTSCSGLRNKMHPSTAMRRREKNVHIANKVSKDRRVIDVSLDVQLCIHKLGAPRDRICFGQCAKWKRRIRPVCGAPTTVFPLLRGEESRDEKQCDKTKGYSRGVTGQGAISNENIAGRKIFEAKGGATSFWIGLHFPAGSHQ